MKALIAAAVLLSHFILLGEACSGEIEIKKAPQVKPANAAKPRQNLQAKQPLKGEILWLDRPRQVVWINLGQAEGLKSGETFSVTTPTDDEAVKGRVEVVRVLAPHLSEARILKEPAKDPVEKGDLVLP